jgi:hypothetical protein
MRKGWRKVLATLGFALLGLAAGSPAGARSADASAVEGARPVRLTVEVAWTTSASLKTVDATEITLEVSEGRVVDAVAALGSSSPAGALSPARKSDSLWTLGRERSGRTRVRIEAQPTSSLLLRAGGQPMRFPLPLVLEGPRKTPTQSPVEITVERVSWDALTVDLTSGDALDPAPKPLEGKEKPLPDGVVAPGSKVAVSVGFNVLSPEATEVVVRCDAELRPIRGGEPVWRGALNEVVATNAPHPAAFVLPVVAPDLEGTYILELKASWEPGPSHDNAKLIGRLIRRGRRGLFGAPSATRRVTLAVVNSVKDKDKTKEKDKEDHKGISTARATGELEVDLIDLSRPRMHRPTASGRTAWPASRRSGWAVPPEALTEVTRRDLLPGWMARGHEVAQIAPANASGLAWSAMGLKVNRPGRPHRLTVTVAGGQPSALGVAVVGVGGNSRLSARPRRLLDACASGPPVSPNGGAATFSWLVWPDAPDPVLVLVNRASGSSVQIGSITLTELPELPEGPTIEAHPGGAARGIGLALTDPDPLERFGMAVEPGLSDALAASKALGSYARYMGATSVVLPEGLADRAARRALDGQAAEDSLGPDKMALALHTLAVGGVSAWVELDFGGTAPLPGLPAPGDAEALARGLIRLDRRGSADGSAPTYSPLCPEVAEALRRRVREAMETHKESGNLDGLLIRLGQGPTLLGAVDTGLDDATFARFLREAFDADTARSLPGTDLANPERFTERSRFVSGSGRTPWLSWRSRQVAALYGSLNEAVHAALPAARLALATPGPDDGAAGWEARRADLAGLAPSLAWRAVGLDLDVWPAAEDAPIVFRGARLGADDLAHDLATSPELDAKVAARPVRGVLLDAGSTVQGPAQNSGVLTLSAPALDVGPNGDEPLGHALAVIDARWVWIAATAAAGQEERVRRFARIFLVLPASTPPPSESQPLPFGVAVRAHPAGDQTYLALANDTPYPIRLDIVLSGSSEATVYDVGRGATLRPVADPAGRHLVLDLLPFGISAVCVGAAEIKVGSVTPYPSDVVLTSMRTQYEALSARLSTLARGGEKGRDKARTGPSNPGFEPDAGHAGVPLSVPNPKDKDREAVEVSRLEPTGWQVVGGMGNGVSIDLAQPRTGRGALRLDVVEPPGSAVCENFTPNAQNGMLVQVWLRSDRPDAKVRIWIEGESAGKLYRRLSEITVQPTWSERAIRAGDIPPGGLDTAHLRFELTGAGSLWVDDLAVSGEGLSEPERRNASKAIMAAIQAYRDKRFADFARLASSHWARSPGVGARADTDPAPDRVASERSGLSGTGDAPATELPRDRRLR